MSETTSPIQLAEIPRNFPLDVLNRVLSIEVPSENDRDAWIFCVREGESNTEELLAILARTRLSSALILNMLMEVLLGYGVNALWLRTHWEELSILIAERIDHYYQVHSAG